MSGDDQTRWDARYADADPVSVGEVAAGLPPEFAGAAELLPTSGLAVDVACGKGRLGLVLARRGLSVTGYDVSPAAIALASRSAAELGLADRCRFVVADLGAGLPGDTIFEVAVCSRYWNESLLTTLPSRLRPGAVLMASALSEVGGEPGRFRLKQGQLFTTLEPYFAPVDVGEADGLAWFVGTRLA